MGRGETNFSIAELQIMHVNSVLREMEHNFFLKNVFIYLAVSSLSWGLRDLCCGLRDSAAVICRFQSM